MARIGFALVVLALALTPAATGGGAPVALLIPAKRISVEGTSAIRLGVRYTANPPGPRWFTVELRNPKGKRVVSARGTAPISWRIWRYDPGRSGVYRTTYTTSTNTEVFRTRVVGCPR